MQLRPDHALHLTYCTNIHAADGWAAVNDNIRRYAPALKARFSPHAPFGIGLRLSARDARELLHGHLDEFHAFLNREGLYVAIINGFPYGSFHRSVVKAEVYAPDWRDDARVAYTLDLVEILRRLLPGHLDGGVSTAPLSYKAWMPADAHADWEIATRNVVRVAERLARIHDTEGKLIHLDIEPEPDCAIENTGETIDFFERWLLPIGAPQMAHAMGVSLDRARRMLFDHIRVCFDCCHFAVEFEDPLVAIERLRRAGVQIGRVQLSSALRVPLPADDGESASMAARLRPFADSTYLHQVIERTGTDLRHYSDLDVALGQMQKTGARPEEWRIHFHVPLFTHDYDGLGSTQDVVRTVLAAAQETPFTTHLEIETYTWDVLPSALKIDLLESIAREYQWVLAATGRMH